MAVAEEIRLKESRAKLVKGDIRRMRGDWRPGYRAAVQREEAIPLTSSSAVEIAFPMPHAIYGIKTSEGAVEYFVCYTKKQEARLLKRKFGEPKPLIVTRGWVPEVREWPNEDGRAHLQHEAPRSTKAGTKSKTPEPKSDGDYWKDYLVVEHYRPCSSIAPLADWVRASEAGEAFICTKDNPWSAEEKRAAVLHPDADNRAGKCSWCGVAFMEGQ